MEWRFEYMVRVLLILLEEVRMLVRCVVEMLFGGIVGVGDILFSGQISVGFDGGLGVVVELLESINGLEKCH